MRTKGATIFALPSHNEPFGIVVLEAWAAGIPVIASRVGGIPGFTHQGDDILLFPDGDKAALINPNLEQLARDPSLRGIIWWLEAKDRSSTMIGVKLLISGWGVSGGLWKGFVVSSLLLRHFVHSPVLGARSRDRIKDSRIKQTNTPEV